MWDVVCALFSDRWHCSCFDAEDCACDVSVVGVESEAFAAEAVEEFWYSRVIGDVDCEGAESS